jgi:hypothetical protein
MPTHLADRSITGPKTAWTLALPYRTVLPNKSDGCPIESDGPDNRLQLGDNRKAMNPRRYASWVSTHESNHIRFEWLRSRADGTKVAYPRYYRWDKLFQVDRNSSPIAGDHTLNVEAYVLVFDENYSLIILRCGRLCASLM